MTSAPLAAVGEAPSALDTRGPAAEVIANVWWLLLGLGTAAFLIAMGFLLVASIRTAREREPGNRFIVGWGIVFPGVLFTGLLGLHIYAGTETYRPNPDPELTVEVIGFQFWWEMRYDDGEVVTANELVIPAGQPVELTLLADDVIHSFWIPALHGKMDMIPGRANTFWVEADEPGSYHGYCAEYCGIQHARMQLTATALEPEEFDAWLEERTQPAEDPETDLAQQGMEVFEDAGCINCHGVQGHFPDPPEIIAPDLTHLASRKTLAAGILENNRGNLAGWLLAPQDLKPGNRMPATDLDGEELQALLAYLEGLE